MFTLTSRHGQLAAGSNGIQTPMSKWENLHVLLRDEDTFGDDTRVSGGKSLNPVRGGGIKEVLEGWMCGDVDHSGTLQSDVVTGLIDNIFWFRSNISERTGSGDGTQTLTLTWGGHTLTGTGRIGPLRVGRRLTGGMVAVTLDVSIPVGTFT